MAEDLQVVPFQEPTLINDIYYADRRLFNIKNSDNSISVGYLTTDQPNDAGQIVPLDGVGNIAILGSFSANSNNYNPSQLSLDEASLTNGNDRISNAIFNDPNYYSLITNTTDIATTSSSPAAGSDGFGDPSVSRATVGASGRIRPTNVNNSVPVRYPLDISADMDHIVFTVVKIEEKPLGTGGGQFSGSLQKTNYITAPKANPQSVLLGIQVPIMDQSLVGWKGDPLNALQLAAANTSVNIATSGSHGEARDAIVGAFKAIGMNITDNKDAIQGILGGLAAGISPQAILSRTARKIINPNLELLFTEPTLRPFNFVFNFFAREKKEADNIKKIIKFFKQNMVPRVETTGGGLFLQTPYVFTIQYKHGSKGLHKSINIISDTPETKACALTGCNVNYTPLGTYMTFDDSERDGDPEATMVAYELTLTFSEIEPIYSLDYEEGEGATHSIGY
jgi:hypothetical protein